LHSCSCATEHLVNSYRINSCFAGISPRPAQLDKCKFLLSGMRWLRCRAFGTSLFRDREGAAPARIPDRIGSVALDMSVARRALAKAIRTQGGAILFSRSLGCRERHRPRFTGIGACRFGEVRDGVVVFLPDAKGDGPTTVYLIFLCQKGAITSPCEE
jgi:hypothetical protein